MGYEGPAAAEAAAARSTPKRHVPQGRVVYGACARGGCAWADGARQGDAQTGLARLRGGPLLWGRLAFRRPTAGPRRRGPCRRGDAQQTVQHYSVAQLTARRGGAPASKGMLVVRAVSAGGGGIAARHQLPHHAAAKPHAFGRGAQRRQLPGPRMYRIPGLRRDCIPKTCMTVRTLC